MKEILSSDPRVQRIMRPSTDTVRIQEATDVLWNEHWEGGSHDSYEARDLATGRYQDHGEPIGQEQVTPFPAGIARRYATRPGVAFIRRSTFQGKRIRDTIILHPEDYAVWSACTLHDDCIAHPELAKTCDGKAGSKRDREILATFSYKSACRKQEQARIGVTAEELQSLVDRGLVIRNRAGAMQLTPTGRIMRAA